MFDIGCSNLCKYHNKPWPRNIPKPTCRLITEYDSIKNPVTKSVVRGIITERIRCADMRSSNEER